MRRVMSVRSWSSKATPAAVALHSVNKPFQVEGSGDLYWVSAREREGEEHFPFSLPDEGFLCCRRDEPSQSPALCHTHILTLLPLLRSPNPLKLTLSKCQ